LISRIVPKFPKSKIKIPYKYKKLVSEYNTIGARKAIPIDFFGSPGITDINQLR